MSLLKKCCVPSCNNTESISDCWFYEFPENENLYDTWIKQCGLSSDADQNFGIRDYSLMICSAHFNSHSFRSGYTLDGELNDDAVPSQNLTKEPIESDTVISPSHLFVALFIDEAGKIVNFSLVQYKTVEKWQADIYSEYDVAEIFTNSDNCIDTKQGHLGPFFNCSNCSIREEFGVVVMQKRNTKDAVQVTKRLEKYQNFDVRINEENEQDSLVTEISLLEDTTTEEMEERLVEYSTIDIVPDSRAIKRKLTPLTVAYNPKIKKSSEESLPVSNANKDETISGIKFVNKQSCIKCNFMPDDEDLLLDHIETCKVGFLSKSGFKSSQRIRNNYICSKCTLSILHRDLTAHAEFHIKFAPFACKCSKCFTTENELAEHSQICGQHLFTCKMCHKEFVKKRDLFQHKADAHGLDPQGQPLKRLPLAKLS